MSYVRGWGGGGGGVEGDIYAIPARSDMIHQTKSIPIDNRIVDVKLNLVLNMEMTKRQN